MHIMRHYDPPLARLVVLDVLETALVAFDEDRLQFQRREKGTAGTCLYRAGRTADGKPIGCGIGVSLSDEVAEALESLFVPTDLDEDASPDNLRRIDTNIDDLLKAGAITSDDDDLLSTLQEKHDSIMVLRDASDADFLRFRLWLVEQIDKLKGRK